MRPCVRRFSTNGRWLQQAPERRKPGRGNQAYACPQGPWMPNLRGNQRPGWEGWKDLTAALTKIFPKIENDYPRDEDGNLIPGVLTDEQFAEHQGLIGHYHIKKSKIDPGPAFQWDYLIEEVEKEHQGWRIWRR